MDEKKSDTFYNILNSYSANYVFKTIPCVYSNLHRMSVLIVFIFWGIWL